jgi:radical SAM superfamily enzyme YgiQ (UPF0313 family)
MISKRDGTTSGKRAKLVLYFPKQANPAQGLEAGRDLLPLSLLTIAGLPDRDGYEVVLIDGNLYPEAEALRRVIEACEGALLYATTGILGYQVTDGFRCSTAVRAAHPRLPRLIGGWFASCAPELQLEHGLYDAVCLGQGELTFMDVIAALEAAQPLDDVPGLALWREGEVVQTAKRAAVGWSHLVNCPWHLLDIEPYRAPQLAGPLQRVVERVPVPPGYEHKPFFGISYYGSYGCPEHCDFCCSPGITDLRWKAMPGERMLDDLCELKERWGFETVRFYDANWGVGERRVRDFCKGLLDRDVRFHWYPLMQAHSLCNYKPETLDWMRDSGMYVINIGAETGDEERLRAIGKHKTTDENERAAVLMDERGITAWMTHIIGFPGESADSMLRTIDQCRRIAAACNSARPTVWPFRPIPGSALYARALELGYRPPARLEDWGLMSDYHIQESWKGNIPREVEHARRMFEHYSTLKFGLARDRFGWWERRAAQRMQSGDFRGARLEAKAFDLYHRLTRGFTARPRAGRKVSLRPASTMRRRGA